MRHLSTPRLVGAVMLFFAGADVLLASFPSTSWLDILVLCTLTVPVQAALLVYVLAEVSQAARAGERDLYMALMDEMTAQMRATHHARSSRTQVVAPRRMPEA